MRYEIPISEDLIDELFPFWASIFGEVLPDIGRQVFLGAEGAYSHSTLYLHRERKRLAGTCFTMHSKTMPALAGFSEVATDPRLRGRALPRTCVARRWRTFALPAARLFLLGTVNPAAARVYHRLGSRKLAGADVMVNVLNGESPESFLVDYFTEGTATVV